MARKKVVYEDYDLGVSIDGSMVLVDGAEVAETFNDNGAPVLWEAICDYGNEMYLRGFRAGVAKARREKEGQA